MSNHIISPIDGNSYSTRNGHFTRHLRSNGLTYREYYEKYVTGVEENCPYCSAPKTFYQHTRSYANTCGSDACYGKLIKDIRSNFSDEKNAKINEKRSNTNLIRYGVKQNTSNPEIKARIKATRQQTMDDGRTKEEHIQENARLGKLKKYGDINYNNRQKIRKTKAAQSDEVKREISEKRRKTNKERFGVECVLLLSTSKIAAANAKIKEFVLPSGRIVRVQGNEPLAIAKLLESYDEDSIWISDARNISTCNMPIINWIDNQRKHVRYYPDIYIPKENRIIEVKSRWWYDGNGAEKYKSRLENNQRKKQACISKGYHFEFWIYETDGRLTILK